MKRSDRIIFLLCGILLTFAAFPVFGQETKINPQPLEDLGAFLQEKIDRGEIDLTQPFKIVFESVITKEGRFDLKKSKFVTAEGDEQMVGLAKTAIEAYGNTGLLAYLGNHGIEKLKVTLMQDEANFSAAFESEQASDEKAQTLASALNTLLKTAKIRFTSEDDRIFLGGFQTVTSSGKTTAVNFSLPKKDIHDLIRRNLKRAAEAEKWKAGE